MILLSHYQARQLILQKKQVSLDLGRTLSNISYTTQEINFPDGQKLKKKDILKILKRDTQVHILEDNALSNLVLFSEETNKSYKLMPTGLDTPPTLEISGIRMHVTKAMSPKEDTEKKISFVMPCTGNVLDTCTGLGYTAIEAAKTAEVVYTFEIDKAVIELEKINPWSKELFEKKNIKTHNADIFKTIKTLDEGFFDRIIHDPPRLTLATLLYSQGFYDELFRVMKSGGILYHYTGEPGSKKRGLDIREGITNRLSKAGFKDIERVFNGLRAKKI